MALADPVPGSFSGSCFAILPAPVSGFRGDLRGDSASYVYAIFLYVYTAVDFISVFWHTWFWASFAWLILTVLSGFLIKLPGQSLYQNFIVFTTGFRGVFLAPDSLVEVYVFMICNLFVPARVRCVFKFGFLLFLTGMVLARCALSTLLRRRHMRCVWMNCLYSW